jgi:hypothetical protein
MRGLHIILGLESFERGSYARDLDEHPEHNSLRSAYTILRIKNFERVANIRRELNESGASSEIFAESAP